LGGGGPFEGPLWTRGRLLNIPFHLTFLVPVVGHSLPIAAVGILLCPWSWCSSRFEGRFFFLVSWALPWHARPGPDVLRPSPSSVLFSAPCHLATVRTEVLECQRYRLGFVMFSGVFPF